MLTFCIAEHQTHFDILVDLSRKKKLKINSRSSKQRWSPRGRPWPRGCSQGHVLKSLASKVKSLALASKLQVLENCPVLGSRTALLFEWLKFCRSAEKFFEDVFFKEHLSLCR